MTIDTIIGQLGVSEGVGQAEWTVLAAPLLMLVVGLLLWLAGSRLLRPAIIVVGTMTGLIAGWAVGSWFEVTIPLWILPLVGAIIFGALAAVLYRFGLAVMLALILALGGAIGMWGAHEIGLTEMVGLVESVSTTEQFPDAVEPDGMPATSDSVPSWPAPAELFDGADSAIGEAILEESKERVIEVIRESADDWHAMQVSTRAWILHAKDTFWDASPGPVRWMMSAAAGLGALIGLVVAAFSSSVAARLVTPMFGSLLVIHGGLGFAEEAIGEPLEWLSESTVMQSLVWVVLTIIGIIIQWTLRPKRADTTG